MYFHNTSFGIENVYLCARIAQFGLNSSIVDAINFVMPEKPYQEIINTLLSQGKSIKITVRGMSMFPILLTTDVVLVKPVEPDDLKYGQVIVFKLGENLVVHRLVGRNLEKGLVYTRGDGLQKRDKPVNVEDVVGIVVGIEKSRWRLAKIAIGRWSPIWAVVMPIIGPFIRAAVKFYCLLAPQKNDLTS